MSITASGIDTQTCFKEICPLTPTCGHLYAHHHLHRGVNKIQIGGKKKGRPLLIARSTSNITNTGLYFSIDSHIEHMQGINEAISLLIALITSDSQNTT